MLILGGTLVSNCHDAVIYMEGTEYHCMRCMQRWRPGRADVHIGFGPAVREQAEAMFAAFYPKASAHERQGFVSESDGMAMAEIQQRLLNRRSLKESALAAIGSNK